MCDNTNQLSTMEKLSHVVDFALEGSSRSTEFPTIDPSKVLRTQRQNKLMASEAADFLLPNELAQSVNLQRELRRLRFENPGEAMVGGTKIKHNPQRPKRRVAAKTNVSNNYKPYHDRHGYLVTASSKSIDLCDCLAAECPGCHRPCRKCNSQKCSFQCRINRSAIVEEIEIQGVGKFVKNINLIRR